MSCFNVSSSQRESLEEPDATEPAVLGGNTGRATMTASEPDSDMIGWLRMA